ncbi:hypothetical protein F946_01396 [Acinetobacter johnsonii ANC 3681]|uniref:Uncharacterized protein n=1 Tax=Acinetobacter johnsonii ANC 3681 TaxID=1217662 RepID=N9CU36_ACIJO|nr:hypothetical protein [Acinetobacter johnsonii]ENV71940.1 hypothetical protein F946_01396 [Acinetobacter johnsonii ANC 3681]
MGIQKENHLLKQFEKTKTFKRFFSTLLRFDEDLDCFIATEKWRDKEAELLSAAWWMFAEVAKIQSTPEGFVLVPKNTINVLEELTQLSSYAEIVGGISVNRAAIRGQCDIAFNLIREFEDAEFLKEVEAQEQSHE